MERTVHQALDIARRGVQALALISLLLLVGSLQAQECKPDGELCRQDRSCCGTTGNNGVCVDTSGAGFGACCTPGIDADCCASNSDCAAPQTCGGGGTPNTCGGPCPCTSGNRIRVATFNLGDPDDTIFLPERLGPQLGVLSNNPFDVLCLNELWYPEIKSIFLQILLVAPYAYVTDGQGSDLSQIAEPNVLFSTLPLQDAEYHPFDVPDTVPMRGVTYARIQKGGQWIHLFCTDMTTAEEARKPRQAEGINTRESLELIDYVNAKANGEIAIVLGDTGNGPAIASAGVDGQWAANFGVLQSQLVDTLLSKGLESCTFGCDENPLSAYADISPRYVDHVMVSGQGTAGPVCMVDAQRIFTQPFIVPGLTFPVPISDHYGVYTDICLTPD